LTGEVSERTKKLRGDLRSRKVQSVASLEKLSKKKRGYLRWDLQGASREKNGRECDAGPTNITENKGSSSLCPSGKRGENRKKNNTVQRARCKLGERVGRSKRIQRNVHSDREVVSSRITSGGGGEKGRRKTGKEALLSLPSGLRKERAGANIFVTAPERMWSLLETGKEVCKQCSNGGDKGVFQNKDDDCQRHMTLA